MPTIQVPPGQPSTPPVALVVRAELLPAGAEQDLDRQHTEERVCDAAAECSDPVEPTVRLFGPVAQEDVHEAPQGVTGEADRDGYEQEPAERLVRDRLQRSALVGGLPAGAESRA